MFLLPSLTLWQIVSIKPRPIVATPLSHHTLFQLAMSAPSIDLFAEVLSEEPDWYSLGVFLGAPTTDLDLIKQEYRGATVTRCLIEVYKCLERLCKAPSWDSISSKLRALDNHALAEHIDSTYIHPSLEPPSESSSSNSAEQSGAGIPDSVAQTSRAPKVTVPPEVSKQYSSLSRRLTKLYFCVQKAISGSDANINDVQHVIKRQWGLQPYTGSDATWKNVFHRLDEECCMFDDPHVLSDIIDIFLPDNQVLSRQMGEFEKAVDSFKSSAQMGHLVKLLRKKKSKGSDSQIVKLKVQERWSRCRLTNFETAMKMLLGPLYDCLSCMLVTDGCCCISWIIAADIAHASQLLPKHSKELFKIIGVISLQIGEEMVYDSTGEVPGCEVLEAAMLQAIELKNTRAIELLLAVGCSPEVATYDRNHAVTNVVNIRERSIDDGSGGGVDHVCVLGHNEHIEAIIDTSKERPEIKVVTTQPVTPEPKGISHFMKVTKITLFFNRDNSKCATEPDYTISVPAKGRYKLF